MKARLHCLFGICAFVLTAAAGPVALASPVGGDVDIRPQRPVNNVSFQASEMIERATRMETAAASREDSARMRESRADTLMTRARVIRNQAALVSFSDRQSMQEIADELTIRASEERSRAAEDRAQASSLRMQARQLRERAVQLVRLGNGGGGGGGWRGKGGGPVREFAAPPQRSETIL